MNYSFCMLDTRKLYSIQLKKRRDFPNRYNAYVLVYYGADVGVYDIPLAINISEAQILAILTDEVEDFIIKQQIN